MTICIRKIKKKEFKDIITLEQRELYPELTVSQLKAWVEETREFSPQLYVAVLNGKIVGFNIFSIYEVNEDKLGVLEIILELSAIAVRSNYQRQRIGEKLLNDSIKEAKRYWENEGFKVMGLRIETGTDEAPGFYEKVLPASALQKAVFEKTWSGGEGIVEYFLSLQDY